MTNMKVVFTAEGLSCTAYFESVCDLDIFARMMANDGRLSRVKVDGADITEEYVGIIPLF